MPELDISKATYSNMTDRIADVTIAAKNLEGATGQDETEYQNTNWSKYFGYYRIIPECKIATDTLARWTIGDGFIAKDARTKVILDHITGWGCDTFDDILENMDRVSSIGGDAFAEIIRDEDTNILLNLKPLDPSSIKSIVDKKGLIKRYEQINKVTKGTIKFKPNEIFHLCNKRIGDEIHGISDYEALVNIIEASNESFMDYRKVMHRYVKPMMKFSLDTDDTTKIDALVAKFDAAVNKGENLYIPKGTVEQELISVPANATISPLSWRDHLKNYFYQVVGIPQILMGGSGEFTESTAKMAYLSFEQTVKQRQRYIITQVWNQLYLEIDLAFPTSLKNEMLSDEQKDKNQGMEIQPSDTIAGRGE
jgi:hypothetical protein